MKYLLVVLVLFFGGSIMGQQSSIEVTMLSNSVFKLYVNNYAYMYVFTGNEGVLLIDTGYETDEESLKNKLDELTTGQVKYIINTHSNGDHVQGNHFFPGATIIAHENCRNDLKDYHKMIIETMTIVRNAMSQGRSLEQIKKDDLLKAYHKYDSKQYSFINAEFWIETIFKNSKKSKQ